MAEVTVGRITYRWLLRIQRHCAASPTCHRCAAIIRLWSFILGFTIAYDCTQPNIEHGRDDGKDFGIDNP
jgi:hypothetical protein